MLVSLFFLCAAFSHAIEIETDRLVLRPTRLEDKSFFYESIYSQADVMKYDMDGDTLPFSWVDQKVNLLVKQWEEEEPFGNFTICLKDDEGQCGEPIGLIRVGDRETIGRGLPIGIAKMVYLLKKESHGKGYGTEAARALVYSYISDLVQKGALLRNEVPLQAIVATVHPDNLASVAILRDKLEMHQPATKEEIELYGLPYDAKDCRFTFFITGEELASRTKK